MPYIEDVHRSRYEPYETTPIPTNGAHLNYVICRLIARFTERHGLHYSVIAEVRDALDGAKTEYNECVANPYEVTKREENGDVWGSLANDKPR